MSNPNNNPPPMPIVRRPVVQAPQYSGKWTLEEEEYAQFLMREFRNGSLNMEEGGSLRGFLAKELQCGPKRISKKYEGTGYNGKQQYVNRASLLTASERDRHEAERESMRQRFSISRERVVNGLATESAPSRHHPHAASSSSAFSSPVGQGLGQGHINMPYSSFGGAGGNTHQGSPEAQSLLANRSLTMGYGIGGGQGGLMRERQSGLGLPYADPRRSIAEEYALQQLDDGWARAQLAGFASASAQQNAVLANAAGQGMFPTSFLSGSSQPSSLYASAMSFGGNPASAAPSLVSAAYGLGALGMGAGGGLSFGGAGTGASGDIQAQLLQSLLLRNNRGLEGVASLPTEATASSPSLRGASATARLDPSLFGRSAASSTAGQPTSQRVDQQALSMARYRQQLDNALFASSSELEAHRMRQQPDIIAQLLYQRTSPRASLSLEGREEEGKRASLGSQQGPSAAAAAAAAAPIGAAQAQARVSSVRPNQSSGHESGSPESKRRRL